MKPNFFVALVLSTIPICGLSQNIPSGKSRLEIDHEECERMAGRKEPNALQKLGAALNPELGPQLNREYQEPNRDLYRLCMREKGYDL